MRDFKCNKHKRRREFKPHCREGKRYSSWKDVRWRQWRRPWFQRHKYHNPGPGKSKIKVKKRLNIITMHVCSYPIGKMAGGESDTFRKRRASRRELKWRKRTWEVEPWLPKALKSRRPTRINSDTPKAVALRASVPTLCLFAMLWTTT